MLSEPPTPLPLKLPSPAAESESDSGSEWDYDEPSPAAESESESSSESDYDEPSEKKQKVNEGSRVIKKLEPLPMDGICPKGVVDIEFSDEFFSPDYDLECWERYWDDVCASEGFDFKEYPGRGPLTTVSPMQFYLEHPKNVEEMKGYAANALVGYNEKNGTKYEVKDIVKLNGEGCQYYNFYLTLTVKNNAEEQQHEEEQEYFQIKVVRDIDQNVEFPIVRPRENKGFDI